MRVFLAGATGAIGRLIVPGLIADGHQVTALTRKAEDAERLRRGGADAVVADVYDAAALTEAVVAARPEAVMHQLTDLADRDFAANAELRKVGTANLVDAALAAGARRVIAQSIAWGYEPGDAPATEEEPLHLDASMPRLRAIGGVTALEQTVAEAPEWVVLRYGLFYGPGTWYTKGAVLEETLRSGQLVPNADISSFIHIEDAAAAAIQALDWPTGPVNIVDDEPAPASEWVPALARSIGAPEPAPVSADRTPWARGADNHYARKHLKWTPRYPSWREGFVS